MYIRQQQVPAPQQGHDSAWQECEVDVAGHSSLWQGLVGEGHVQQLLQPLEIIGPQTLAASYMLPECYGLKDQSGCCRAVATACQCAAR